MAKGKSGYIHTGDQIWHHHIDEARFNWLTNRSGGSVAYGDVVVWDTSNDDSFTTTTVEGNVNVCGVVAKYEETGAQALADAATGWVRYNGLCASVNIDETANLGDWLVTSSTAKKAHPISGTVAPVGAFGLVTVAGASECEAMIFASQRTAGLHPVARAGGAVASGSITYNSDGSIADITEHVAGNNYHKRSFTYQGGLLSQVVEEYPVGTTVLTWEIASDEYDRIKAATIS